MDKQTELRNYKKRLVKELINQTLEELGGFKATDSLLARIIAEPVREIGLSIHKQSVWSWRKGRTLPSKRIFVVINNLAEPDSLPKKFAQSVLQILNTKETVAQKNIRELGYDDR